jgi:3-hydroxyacyl-[acyl-carrier-protein] dehydratase
MARPRPPAILAEKGRTIMSEQAAAPGSALADVDISGIMRMIPHRYPFLLIDRVVEIAAFERAVGIKNVTINEPFFPGHFPTDPIMPGVLVVEAMAQSAAVLVVASLGPRALGSGVYFMGIDQARFRRPVRPGDQIRLEVETQRSKLGVWKFAGKAVVDGRAAAEAEFSAKLLLPA